MILKRTGGTLIHFRRLTAAFAASALLTGISVYAKPDKGHDKHKSLPPGLAKKAAQGKPLPPGWQKKLHKGDVLDKEIYERGRVVVPLGKDGTVTVEVEGTLLKLYEHSRKIVDIINP
jgi:hypothetical protein